jgi:hypothetical protein
MNVAFTKHITNALMQIREEKLKQKVSIPKKLEDGWEPIIEMNVNDFDCHALCDLGAIIYYIIKTTNNQRWRFVTVKLSSINGGDLKHVYGEHIQRQDLIPVSSENAILKK